MEEGCLPRWADNIARRDTAHIGYNFIYMYLYEVLPRSNGKKQIKRERLQVEGKIFFFYLKASIDDLITLLSSSVQNSERGGDGDGSDSWNFLL